MVPEAGRAPSNYAVGLAILRPLLPAGARRVGCPDAGTSRKRPAAIANVTTCCSSALHGSRRAVPGAPGRSSPSGSGPDFAVTASTRTRVPPARARPRASSSESRTWPRGGRACPASWQPTEGPSPSSSPGPGLASAASIPRAQPGLPLSVRSEVSPGANDTAASRGGVHARPSSAELGRPPRRRSARRRRPAPTMSHPRAATSTWRKLGPPTISPWATRTLPGIPASRCSARYAPSGPAADPVAGSSPMLTPRRTSAP